MSTPNRSWLIGAAMALVLAACTADSPTPSPTAEPTAPPPTATEEPTPSPTPTAEPTEAPTPSPTAVPTVDAGGGFTVTPHPGADALFLERDDCQNPRDGYQLQFPEDWWTNTEIGRHPPCIWFSPTFYTVPDPSVVPDEIAITIEYMEGDFGTHSEEPIRRDALIVGGQSAVRVEYPTAYHYQIQLGPTPEEGPNLLASTTTEMGGDYELNKAVLDRIMATIEFIGSTQ